MSDVMSRLRQLSEVYSQSYPPSIHYTPTGPHINSLTPSTMSAAGGAKTITVAGTGFVTGCHVEIDGLQQTTTFVSATSVTISYAPVGAQMVVFTVRNPDTSESNDVLFAVSALSEDALAAQQAETNPDPEPEAESEEAETEEEAEEAAEAEGESQERPE